MKKSEQIQQEIDKAEEKALSLQRRLKELRQQKREAEDAELLSMVKEINCDPGELHSLLKAFSAGDLNYFAKRLQQGGPAE